MSKAVKNHRQFCGRNADAGVADRELDMSVTGKLASRHGHRALVGKLKRIVDEVLQDMFEFIAIAVQQRKIGRKVPLDANFFSERIIVEVRPRRSISTNNRTAAAVIVKKAMRRQVEQTRSVVGAIEKLGTHGIRAGD